MTIACLRRSSSSLLTVLPSGSALGCRSSSRGWGVEQAAQHLACKRQRVYDLVSRRTIPHRKEGSRLLFKLSHLDAWVESGGAA